MQNYRFPGLPDPLGPLNVKNRKKSLTFHANCRNSSPSKFLGGRSSQVGRVDLIISTLSVDVDSDRGER